MAKRTGKFYYRNERETLSKLGFKPALGSGNGWIVKEDGENELSMVQLKSTDSNQYTLKMLDMKKLEYHAAVSHKIPIFLVQFLQQDKTYAIIPVDCIADLKDCFEQGKPSDHITILPSVKNEPVKRKTIKTSKQARETFHQNLEQERTANYGKRKHR